MTTIDGVGPQLARAAAGTDPRGWLVFEHLPADLQALEDSRAVADRDVPAARGFTRPATPTEVALLSHLGHDIPEALITAVSYPSKGCRRRRWPQLEEET